MNRNQPVRTLQSLSARREVLDARRAALEKYALGKDGRHLHAGSLGGYRLAYVDCPCWQERGGYSHALSPVPPPSDRIWLMPPPVMR